MGFRIVADDKIPFLKGALDKVARVDYIPGSAITRDDLRNADALITRTRTKCDRNLLEGTGIQFIASATIGTDHIDADYCDRKGISWTNAPGCNSSSVQQYLVSTLLWLSSGKHLDLGKLTLGVVGVGNVGSKVARAAGILGMRILLNDPPRQREEGPGGGFVDLDELCRRSDIITLHVPLTRSGEDATWHMVDRTFLQQVKTGATIINTSRGGVVDEKALGEEILQKKLSQVILDVFEEEPEVNPDLLQMISLATPHIAGYSLDGKANGTTVAVRSVSRYFGLGLDHWEPGSIPDPEPREILADTSGRDPLEVLWEVYRQTYDVSEDDRRLRADPSVFEKLRGNYPPRREPPAYSVRLFQGHPEIISMLEGLGFSVLSDYCA